MAPLGNILVRLFYFDSYFLAYLVPEQQEESNSKDNQIMNDLRQLNVSLSVLSVTFRMSWMVVIIEKVSQICDLSLIIFLFFVLFL